MTPQRGVALLLAALVVAGCGAQSPEPTADRANDIPVDDLAVMAVPPQELGSAVTGLTVSVGDSGPSSNLGAADDSLDPADTGKSLGQDGRVAGYELVYTRVKPARKPAGLLGAGTSVELFRDPVYATQYLSKQVSDYDRFAGKTVDGVRLSGVQSFDGGAAGEQAYGIRASVRTGRVKVHATLVALRRGRLVGVAWMLRLDKHASEDEVRGLALTLDSRIQRVLSGQVDEEPVALPGKPRAIDPKPLVLRLEDLPPATTATGEGYRQTRGIPSFLREFEVPGNKLGGSTVTYLRTMTQVLPGPRKGPEFLRQVQTRKGGMSVARAFVQGIIQSKVANLRVRRFEVQGRGTEGSILTFDLAGQPVKTILVYVNSGRLLASVTALGPADELHPADVVALVPKIRARLKTSD